MEEGDPAFRVLHGDCLDVLPTLPDASAAAFFCDLPYGETGAHWDRALDLDEFWRQAVRVGKPDCVFAFTATFRFAVRLHASNPAMFRYECVVQKSNVSNPMLAGFRHMPKHELLLVFYKRKPRWRRDAHHTRTGTSPSVASPDALWGKTSGAFTRRGPNFQPPLPTTLLRSDTNGAKSKHGTRKDPRMIRDLLKYWCEPGDLVVDPTCGSGATAEACAQLGLRFVGIEKDAATHGLALRRVLSSCVSDNDDAPCRPPPPRSGPSEPGSSPAGSSPRTG